MSVVSQRRLEDFLCLLVTTAFTIGVRWSALHGHVRSCVIARCVLKHCRSKRCHCQEGPHRQKRDHTGSCVCHSLGSCHPASWGRGHPCCLMILMHLLQIKHPLLAQPQDSGRVALDLDPDCTEGVSSLCVKAVCWYVQANKAEINMNKMWQCCIFMTPARHDMAASR